MIIPKSSILFIDAYDSFSNNIISLLETELLANVNVVHIDTVGLESDEALFEELTFYDAVVCGPGPGTPLHDKDVGLMKRIWRLRDEHLLPVLGICLGFQSLALEFGGIVRKLKMPQHGMIRHIDHLGEKRQSAAGMFSGVGEVKATLYHSLCVDLGQDVVSNGEWEYEKWTAFSRAPDLQPLAWWEGEDGPNADNRVLMAIQHSKKPFSALQYHPESICTNEESKKVIKRWFKSAVAWSRHHRVSTVRAGPSPYAVYSMKTPLLSPNYVLQNTEMSIIETNCPSNVRIDDHLHQKIQIGLNNRYEYIALELPSHVDIPAIIEYTQDESQERLIFESANANESLNGGIDVRGRYSIIGANIDAALKVEYRIGNDYCTVITIESSDSGDIQRQTIPLQPYGGIWQFVARWMDERSITDGNRDSPFWGGFMGYTTYELGLEGINVEVEPYGNRRLNKRPDLCFAWVTSSVVIDHLLKKVYVQQLLDQAGSTHCGDHWYERIASSMKLNFDSTSPLLKEEESELRINSHANSSVLGHNRIKAESKIVHINKQRSLDQEQDYMSKVSECQRHIRNGDSYELCLTNQIHVSLPRTDCPHHHGRQKHELKALKPSSKYADLRFSPGHASPTAWALYAALRAKQPAPFASFVRLGAATLVSSSPERFLQWSTMGPPLAPPPSLPTTTPSGSGSGSGAGNVGHCSLRPMKGTVRKTSATQPTLREAERLLQVPKERAENLMIVDLVRHDLHGVCGAIGGSSGGGDGSGGAVRVPKLMGVEEYASVFQMVSVVEGTFNAGGKNNNNIINNVNSINNDNGGDGGGARDAGHGNEAERGKKAGHGPDRSRYTGVDVLAASLPPGSMTGAPKKRSCEILRAIEGLGQERGLYSGVVGYMDVGGRGDFSVTIRSLFRWDDEEIVDKNDDVDAVSAGAGAGAETAGADAAAATSGVNSHWFSEAGGERVRPPREVWHVGAGGAVTALSTPEGETEEMRTKLMGTLGVIGVDVRGCGGM